MSLKHENDAEILAGGGSPAPPPEALPGGVLPDRPFLDAWNALGWIAWRTATWMPIEAMPTGADRDARTAALDRAHAELLAALASGQITAVACRPAAYVPGEGISGVTIAPASVAEPIAAAVFCTPGLRIESHGHVTLRFRPQYEPDGGAELPLYVAIRFPAAALADRWPVVPEEVTAWILAAATAYKMKHGAKAKKADLVRDCVSILKCRYEDAEEAQEQLPDALRRSRGERDRKSKSAS